MDRGAWWATVHGVEKIWTQVSAHAKVITWGLKSKEGMVGTSNLYLVGQKHRW